MKVITLTAHKRTTELAEVLDALVPQLGDWKLLVSLDGTDQAVADTIMTRWTEAFWTSHNDPPLGIQTHQRELVRMALDAGAEAVACLQDDTVPLPDAVSWLDTLVHVPDLGLLHHPSLGLTASGGRAVWRPHIDPEQDRRIALPGGPVFMGSVFCAEGCVAIRRTWEKLLPHWNGPTDFLDGDGRRYVGWDFSLACAVRRLGLEAWAPPTSRIRCIGTSGTNANPRDFALVNG